MIQKVLLFLAIVCFGSMSANAQMFDTTEGDPTFTCNNGNVDTVSWPCSWRKVIPQGANSFLMPVIEQAVYKWVLVVDPETGATTTEKKQLWAEIGEGPIAQTHKTVTVTGEPVDDRPVIVVRLSWRNYGYVNSQYVKGTYYKTGDPIVLFCDNSYQPGDNVVLPVVN